MFSFYYVRLYYTVSQKTVQNCFSQNFVNDTNNRSTLTGCQRRYKPINAGHILNRNLAFFCCNLHLHPMTLTYELDLDILKM